MPVISAIVLLGTLAQSGLVNDGVKAFEQGRYDDAKRLLDQSLERDGADETGRAFLAMAQAATGDCDAAEREFRHEQASSKARLVGLAAARCFESSGQSLKAFQLMEGLQRAYSRDADVLYALAKFHQNSWNSSLDKLYRADPSSYRMNQLSAEILEIEGKYGAAASQYAAAIAKEPGALSLHFRRGRCLILQASSPENLKQARDEFEQELKLTPSDATAEFEIGQIELLSLNPGKAREHFGKALALRPRFPEAIVASAKIEMSTKNYDSAIALLKRAVEIEKDNEAAHYNLMIAYRNSGRTAEAVREKAELDRIQRPPEGEFADFLKKLEAPAPDR